MTTDNTPSPGVTNAEALLSARPSSLDQAPVVAPSKPRGKPSLTMILGGVVAAGALFAGGMLLGNHMGESSSASDFPGAQGGFAGARGTDGAGGLGGGFTSGEITAVDGGTLTIKAADGTTVTVTTTTDTTVTRSEASDVASLAVGEQVTVIGQTADGAVTARSITEGSGGLSGFGGFPGGGTDQLPGQAAATS